MELLNEMNVIPIKQNALKKSPVSQVPAVSDDPVVKARTMPPTTWNGTQVGVAETVTHYLHLTASPCEKCNGPVIAGSLGTRQDDISQETDIKTVGAICIACGFRPEFVIEPSVDHRFRPVEWRWAIKHLPRPAATADDPLAAELSQDADI
jgi:hypothetical protein